MPRRKSLILLVFFMQKVLDFITPMYYIKSMKGNTNMKVKGNGPKRRNPIAAALRQNKCFTKRAVRVKVRYSRNPKHKGKEFGND